MDILRNIRTIFSSPLGRSGGAFVYTPELLLAMKNLEKERIKAMTIELAKTALNLTKKDIATWRTAWQMAINPENPQRRRL